MVFTVFLSVAILHKNYSLTQYASLVFIVAGLIVVTLSDLYEKSESVEDASPVTIGFICMILG